MKIAWFISSHGFGHAARAVAIAQAMRRQRPDCEFLLLTATPAWFFDELGPGTTVVRISGQSARYCSVTRTVTYADGTSKKDKFSSNYPMFPKTVEVPPSTTTTTTTPPTTVPPGSTTTVVTEF